MPPRTNCPVCGSDMRSRSLLDHYSMKPYRVCPDCEVRYTVDASTRRRQILTAVFGLVTFGLSIASRLNGFPWGLAALLSGMGLLIYVAVTLSKITYVEFRD